MACVPTRQRISVLECRLPLAMLNRPANRLATTPIMASPMRYGSTARAVLLLVCYSAGLGVPFLLVGLGVSKFMGAFEWVKRRYTAIAIVSGGLMIAIGVLLFSGEFTRLVAPLAERFTLGL